MVKAGVAESNQNDWRVISARAMLKSGIFADNTANITCHLA